MKNHPERKPGEAYLGNARSLIDFGHKTVRFGNEALDINDKPIPVGGARLWPVFVDAKELLARLDFLVKDYAFDPRMAEDFAKDAADLRAFVKEQDGIDL